MTAGCSSWTNPPAISTPYDHLLWEYLHERNSLDGTTIVVVSHNLPEVETVAQQAILIDQGHVAALGTLGDLKKAVADEVRIELRLRREEPATAAILSAVPGARNPRPGLWVIATPPEKAPDLLHQILAEVDRRAVDDFRLVTTSLDDVYLHFTGKEVRHDDGV